MDLAALGSLLTLLREHGVWKYTTAELSLEMMPFATGAAAAAADTEEEDFDPAQAYQDAVKETAAAITSLREKGDA